MQKPTAKEFVKYFNENPISDVERKMLITHYSVPGHAIMMGEMATELGYKGFGGANAGYGTLAHRVMKKLEKKKRDDEPYIAIFVKKFAKPEKNYILYMSDELAEALEDLKWVKRDMKSLVSLSEIDSSDPESFEEGGVKFRTIKQYERSTKARRECISKNGDSCTVCDLSFKEAFGDDFDGLIVIHHTKPLAVKEIRKTDPINDMKPLCPNCHAMAHYGLPGDKPRSIEELRKIIRK